MRICMLAYSFYENDSRMLQYAKALVQRGDVVDVIALRREGQPDYEVLNGVNVFRIQSRTVDEYKARDHLVQNSDLLTSGCNRSDKEALAASVPAHSCPFGTGFSGLRRPHSQSCPEPQSSWTSTTFSQNSMQVSSRPAPTRSLSTSCYLPRGSLRLFPIMSLSLITFGTSASFHVLYPR